MNGIDLDMPIGYRYASLRFFMPGERHISRVCVTNVLLLVYEGVLRFSENGEQVEVHAGEYYIQRENCTQGGELVSDSPKYLYVHFAAEWREGDSVLPRRGRFEPEALLPQMRALDTAAHNGGLYTECHVLLLSLLLALRRKETRSALGARCAEYVEKNLGNITSLDSLCQELHYSKNYVIRIFRRELGASPIKYINSVRISRAAYLLESTSRSIKDICRECGYTDYAYFYKCFVRTMGLAPLEFRRRKRRGDI